MSPDFHSASRSACRAGYRLRRAQAADGHVDGCGQGQEAVEIANDEGTHRKGRKEHAASGDVLEPSTPLPVGGTADSLADQVAYAYEAEQGEHQEGKHRNHQQQSYRSGNRYAEAGAKSAGVVDGRDIELRKSPEPGALLAADAYRTKRPLVTYVLSPVVDVVPPGSPLDVQESQALMSSLRTPEDAKDVQDAFATLGSTLSLHDLLRGVEALEGTETPLTSVQTEEIGGILAQARDQHKALREVQEEILVLEAKLGRDVNRMMMRIPAEDRTRIVAAIGGRR